MKLRRGIDATLALQSARHKVFVEGSDDEEIDPVVISELLKTNGLPQIDVRPMGGCDNVRSAAQALIRDHPSYYFLIDRDDQDIENVEKSWTNFPNSTTHNMVIWRKRELENYFIDPAYIEKSEFLRVTPSMLRQRILDECNRRLFLDAANLTLSALKRSIRIQFAPDFTNPTNFKTEADGAKVLDESIELEAKRNSFVSIFKKTAVNKIYSDFVAELCGGSLPLTYGSGTWLERMSGKETFRSIAGSCFRVTAASGTTLRGKIQNNEIAKQLLQLPLTEQPQDFQILVNLLDQRAKSSA